MAFALLPTLGWGQSAAVKKIMEMAREDNRTMQHLDILCNRFGGRPIGSDAYENAAEWAMRCFREWGYEVEYEKAGELSVGFNRGGWWGRAMGEYTETLYFTTPSYTSGTKGPQRGHVVIEPRTWDEFNRMKGTLKGAWVLVGGTNSGWPLPHSAKDDSIRAEQQKEMAEIAKKNNEIRMKNRMNKTNEPLLPMKEIPGLFYREMVEAGVLGFVQSSAVPIRALYDRPMINDKSTTFDNLPEVCDIKLDENQFAVIKKMAQERREFWLEFDIRNHFKLGPIKYHNVVASIKGTQYPDEYVIISGHLDAFDVATGGVDCGTGIAPMMEAARLIALSGAKPKRTILFVGFAGEEFGLLGAKAFCETHKNKLGKIANLFNRDGGPTPPVGIAVSKAGVVGKSVDNAARKVIEDAGYGEFIGHGYGHSLGLEVHEAPNCSPAGETVMEVGVVSSAEPGIYLPGKFGVCIEDVTIFKADGCENITNSTKNLIII